MDILNELLDIKEKLDKLSAGIDPYTDLEFPNDTILKNRNISLLFDKTSKIISHILIETGGDLPKSKIRKKFPFYLGEDDKDKIKLSNSPISVSEFTYIINNTVYRDNMKKLRATQITQWLSQNGFLKETEINNRNYKFPTEQGISIGISFKKKINSFNNEYAVNLYSLQAQEFILKNIGNMLDECNTKLVNILNNNDCL